MGDIKFWAAFSLIPQLGTVKFRRLEEYFGDLGNAWNASQGELRAAGIESRLAEDVVSARKGISPDGEMEKLDLAGVRLANWNDASYPPRLKEIHDPPPLLYFKGEILPADERSVAVVGTRGPTAYGREAAALFASDLARNNVTIVSGLARGIDGIAHRSALESQGRTVAVVASGLDIVYPREHSGLYQQIQGRGAVITEYPLGVRPDARNFPRRNRIISGVTLGTLVIEAGENSGALWTVHHALDQNREVFCVPGSIFSPASRGTNDLIQQGAKLVSDYKHVLEELNLTVAVRPVEARRPGEQIEMPISEAPADANESAVLRYLNEDPVHIDDIRRSASLPITVVSSLLAVMELKGLVKQVGCMHYIRMREATAAYGG